MATTKPLVDPAERARRQADRGVGDFRPRAVDYQGRWAKQEGEGIGIPAEPRKQENVLPALGPVLIDGKETDAVTFDLMAAVESAEDTYLAGLDACEAGEEPASWPEWETMPAPHYPAGEVNRPRPRWSSPVAGVVPSGTSREPVPSSPTTPPRGPGR